MSFFDGYNVATAGMSAQRTRINIVSSNIANAQTTHTTDGGPYKKQNVVFEEVLLDSMRDEKKNPNQDSIDPLSLRGVGVKEIIDSKDKPILKYEPEHPDANQDGYVAYPNINPVIEMVDLMEAMRSYEANVASFKTQKDMDTKTLDIIKS
ncbi:flagellar basal body rod protein FlgC [Arcobacter sp. 15-2]|uniref:flagellar basal body rod protein FlgC n=1 Tax=Arcobacter sp. 15-2 TaxID=3374109 RepID=UPI00399D27B6